MLTHNGRFSIRVARLCLHGNSFRTKITGCPKTVMVGGNDFARAKQVYGSGITADLVTIVTFPHKGVREVDSW